MLFFGVVLKNIYDDNELLEWYRFNTNKIYITDLLHNWYELVY